MIKIAIIGTGRMATSHARAYAEIKGCKVVAGVDLNQKQGEAFCKEYNIKESYTSTEELLKNCDFDAASVVTPDAFHVACALPLVKAGKHILCEKPIAPEAKEAKKLVVAAQKAGVINMINFSYRNSPALHKIHDIVASGKIGRIMHFEAHYLQAWLSSKVWGDWREESTWLWRMSTAHGSKGVLGDVGVHIVDLATFAANDDIHSMNGCIKTFNKTKTNKHKGYTLDANDSAFMRVELKNGGMGIISATRWASGQVNSLALNLYGDKGGIRLDLDKSREEYEICVGKDHDKAKWKTVKVKATPNMYKRFITSIRTGKNDASTFERGWIIQKALDTCIQSSKTGKTINIK